MGFYYKSQYLLFMIELIKFNQKNYESKREHLGNLKMRKISQMNYKPGSVI